MSGDGGTGRFGHLLKGWIWDRGIEGEEENESWKEEEEEWEEESQ